MPQHFTKRDYAIGVGIQLLLAIVVYVRVKPNDQQAGVSMDWTSTRTGLVRESPFTQDSWMSSLANKPPIENKSVRPQWIDGSDTNSTSSTDLLSSGSLLFNKNFIFRGEWSLRSTRDLFTNQSLTEAPQLKRKGIGLGMFHYGWFPEYLRFTLNILDEEYTDTPRLVMTFDLYSGKLTEYNSTLAFSPKDMGYFNVERVYHLAFREGNFSRDYSSELRLVDKSTGLPFNMRNPQYPDTEYTEVADKPSGGRLEDLMILLDVDCKDLEISFQVELNFTEPSTRTLKEPVIFLLLIVLSMSLIIEGSNKLEEGYDYYFLSNVSFPSLMVLTVIHFQYVGAFILFMVVIDTPFVLFFVFASVATTFNTVFVFKTCFIVFLYNYIDHPLIDAVSFRSPRVAFTIASLLSMIGFYVVSILLVGFKSYAYYLAVLHLLYPLLHLLNTMKRKTKQCFSRHLQLYIWFPSALFALMLRGYNGNMLNLEPSYLMTTTILVAVGGGSILSYFQSIKGALFMIPESWNLGYKKLLVTIDKVPQHKLEEDCPICYDQLLRPPIEAEGVEMVELNQPNALKESLIQKNYKLAKGPCTHYFHPACLISWLDKKPECPVCKHPINV